MARAKGMKRFFDVSPRFVELFSFFPLSPCCSKVNLFDFDGINKMDRLVPLFFKAILESLKLSMDVEISHFIQRFCVVEFFFCFFFLFSGEKENNRCFRESVFFFHLKRRFWTFCSSEYPNSSPEISDLHHGLVIRRIIIRLRRIYMKMPFVLDLVRGNPRYDGTPLCIIILKTFPELVSPLHSILCGNPLVWILVDQSINETTKITMEDRD